jgi:hypothetical protein
MRRQSGLVARPHTWNDPGMLGWEGEGGKMTFQGDRKEGEIKGS